RGPTPVENFFGSKIMRWFQKIAVFGICLIKRERDLPPASLLGVGAPPFLRQEMLESPQKKGAKLSFPAFYPAQIVPRQQPRKEFLSEILCVVSRIALPAHVSVKWVPVSAAQLR